MVWVDMSGCGTQGGKTCPAAGGIENGYFTEQSGPYGKDCILSVVCHNGYSQIGSPSIKCNETVWIGSPKCSLEFIHDG